MPAFRENKHRLPPERYIGQFATSFTLCVDRKHTVFHQRSDIEIHVELLTEQLRRFECLAPIYCFMPDHLHVVTMGMTDTANSKLAMDAFKLKSGKFLHRTCATYRWQANYHDRIIRVPREWKKKIFYVFKNPVRAGLIEDPYEYPLSGSISYRFEEIIWDAGQ